MLDDRFLAPKGTDEALLSSAFLMCTSEGEAQVVTGRLGVQRLTAPHFFSHYVLPRWHLSHAIFRQYL
jgi:hypothetical protein